MKDTLYFRQAELVLDTLPFISKESVFAVKGGTAINFFVRNQPRLSVDIDLTYLPLEGREAALVNISNTLLHISDTIKRAFPIISITPTYSLNSNYAKSLIVSRNGTTIKVEPNLVIRGSVYPTQTLSLCQKAKDMFERAIDIQSVSVPDLYGGKICAALDRQHPRDLFDIKLLLENEGLSNKIRKAFVVYLISHNRPMVEILDPGLQNLTETFNLEFEGMTIKTVTLDELVSVRSELIKVIKQSLTIDERKFILSVKSKNPQWELIGIDYVKDLPAVKWKLGNLNRMDITKHKKAVKKLKDYLDV
ncbi:MAG TPA: nucleotidyl transferase AbiEii/AbiGii toxin family protein [Sedimentisphaerales bacterium]|nr:nucleotidyl transferase AbiEii/AbiGii toxin family protein [Sedimentisphaerales bacterium]